MKDITETNRAVAFKLLLLETTLTAVAALVLWLGFGTNQAVSVLLGGLAYIVPNAYFAKYVFKFSAEEAPELALRGLYVGEVVKIVATIMIFAFGFMMVKEVNIAVLIVTYIALLIIHFLGFSTMMTNPP